MRQVASEIRRLPNPNDTEAQNEICAEITGRTLDELSQEDAADARFYRQYRKMDSATKAKVRQIIKLWDEDT